MIDDAEGPAVCCPHCRQVLPGQMIDEIPPADESKEPPRANLSEVCSVDQGQPESAVNEQQPSSPLPSPAPLAETGASRQRIEAANPLSELEDWEFEEDLRHIQRTLAVWDGGPSQARRASVAATSDNLRHERRLDDSHAANNSPQSSASAAKGAGAMVHGLLQTVGIAASACGLVLLAWCLFGSRADLWNAALVAVVLGQFSLVGSLMLGGRAPEAIRVASPEPQPAPPAPWFAECNIGNDPPLSSSLVNRAQKPASG